MTLPYDYTFCVSATCGKREQCARYDHPKVDRPLSFADLHRERQFCPVDQRGECEYFILRKR